MPSYEEQRADVIAEREKNLADVAEDAARAIRYGSGPAALWNAREGEREAGYAAADARRELRAVQFAEEPDREAEIALMVRLYRTETAQKYHRGMIDALEPVVSRIEDAVRSRGRVDPEIRDLARE